SRRSLCHSHPKDGAKLADFAVAKSKKRKAKRELAKASSAPAYFGSNCRGREAVMDQAMMDRFDRLKKEFDEACQHEQQKLVRSLPKVLYHYTNVRGFMGILCSGELQASNILYMNDASELEYGRRLVEKLFLDLRSDVEELPGFLSRLDLWLS